MLACQVKPSRDNLTLLRDALTKLLGIPRKRKRQTVNAVQELATPPAPVSTLCFRCDDVSYWEFFQDDNLVAVQVAGTANELPLPKHGNFVCSNLIPLSGNVELLIGLKAPVLSCCVCQRKFARTDILRKHFTAAHPTFLSLPYYDAGLSMVLPLWLAFVVH
jgi:hypothetical protein